MLSTPPIWMALLLGGVIIPLLGWIAVGTRRRRDPLLLPLTILVSAFIAAGIGTAILSGRLLNSSLGMGFLAAVFLRARWMRTTARANPDA